tara:strand:+ start:1365 stop:2021 length:657 start_codon:yes stop_codon:yes gene_type:complete
MTFKIVNDTKLFNKWPARIYDFSNHPSEQTAFEVMDSMHVHDQPLMGNGLSSFNHPSNEFKILHQPRISRLKEDIEACVNKFKLDFPLGLNQHWMTKTEQKLQITNSWFNIMNEGGEVRRHDHPESPISGAFYIKSGNDSPPLYFVHPETKLTEDLPTIEGTLLLFSGELVHGTRIKDMKSMGRTVITFNTHYDVVATADSALYPNYKIRDTYDIIKK